MSGPAASVLLIYPPSRTQRHGSCPMALTMLGAVLEQAGHRVHLLDANAAKHPLDTPQIVEKAKELRPDVIGMTLLTPMAHEAYRLAAALKPLGTPLVAGGPHATLLPEEPLGHGFDAVVVGEGEPTIVEAVEALLGRRPMDSVEGLVHRGPDGATRHNPARPPVADLDTLLLPARHLVDPAQFGTEIDGPLHTLIFTSRGCPGRCAYCAGGLFGKKFRFRSADAVVDEMVLVHREYGTRHFYFADDAMTMNKERMARICDRLIDRQYGFTWSMMTRIDSVDEEMLAHASRAGCVQIDYGVESGHPETLKRIHKPHTVEMVRRIVPLTHRYGIRPAVFFILGFPWEDVAALDDTLRLMRDIAPYCTFSPAIASILIPFPGTEIYERYKDAYSLENWWLSDDRSFDAPRIGTHPFYQSIAFRLGAVLDADFFHYSPQVRAKIHEIFRFMHVSNLRQHGLLGRTIRLLAFDLSRKLDALSPTLERAIFTGPMALWKKVKGLKRVQA